MSNLFRPASAKQPTPPAATLRIQSALDGKPRAIVWGQTRIATNIIWYGDFVAVPVQQSSSGGKGLGGGGGGGKGSSGSGTYNYFAAVQLALGEGVISSIGRVWNSKSLSNLATLNLGFFSGTDSQVPWSYMTTRHPSQARANRRTAYLAAGPMALGNTPELPNLTFEAQSAIGNAAPGVTDANPGDLLADYLANTIYGVPGWQSSFNGDWSIARGYWLAANLLVSYALTDLVSAGDWARTFCEALNTDPVWSDKVLKLVPRGDQPISAGTVTASSVATSVPNAPSTRNLIQPAAPGTFVSDGGVKYTGSGTPFTRVGPAPGTTNALLAYLFGLLPLTGGQYTVDPQGNYNFSAADVGLNITLSYSSTSLGSYNPPAAPLFDLTDADFLPLQGGSGSSSDPVAGVRKAPREQYNVIKVEYLDRANDYNQASTSVQNPAAIALFGKRTKDSAQWHWFQTLAAAQAAAQLALGREAIRNQYTVTVRPRFILLDPGDLVTLTDPNAGLNRQWVRLLDVQENSDRSLTLSTEEYLYGSGAAPLYGQQANSGNKPNYEADPGALNAPLIFEPTDALAGGLEIWIAISGQNTSLFGGYDAYLSYDGVNYAAIDGAHQLGPSRMGVLTSGLAAVSASVSGQTIDTADTLSVDLSESASQLISGSLADALAFNTACYVGGEIIAFQTATLTGTNKYDLTYLVRGGFGSAIAAHGVGSVFCRIDQGILKIPFDQSRIGSTVYFKFVPFNVWGGGGLTVADVPAYAYTITGVALASALPDVQNFVASFVGEITYLDWDIVKDFRANVQYELRKGGSWDAGQYVGTYAHPHVPAIGDAPYWIKAVCTPVTGLTVYSTNATLLSINGSVIPANLLASYDEGAAGWSGSVTGSVVSNGTFIQTNGAGANSDIYAVADIYAVPDIYGVVPGGGYYTIPDSHIVSVGRSAPCLVQVIFAASGAPASADFFAPSDFFNQADVFGSSANRFVDVHPEIAISTDGINFGPWQRYAAGFYLGWKFKARVFLSSLDPANVTAFLTQFVFVVYAPTRTDHPLVNAQLPALGQSITFAPDGALPAAFNGGPNGGIQSGGPGIILPAASVPGVQVTIINKQQGDDLFITSLSLSGMTLQAKNAGVGVQRNVTAQIWGF